MDQEKNKLTAKDIEALNTNKGLKLLLKKKKINVDKILDKLAYEEELINLQAELVKLQEWGVKNNKRIAILFEGRDAAGKGGSIKRFTEHLMPRHMRLVALQKPTEKERGQWYFQRYVKELPSPGEMVFFDRSWYNRAVVEPAMGFCTETQHEQFLKQVPEFEHMLYEDEVILFKFWFAISKEEQKKRFDGRRDNPLKKWKLSPVDLKAQKLWDKFTFYKDKMFSHTHTIYSPWIIVEANDKKKARLDTIRYVLNQIKYEGKNDANISLHPNPETVMRYHRSTLYSDNNKNSETK
jgi:polyphosphate kinase 2